MNQTKLQKIATGAQQQPKPTKRQCFDSIKVLIEKGELDDVRLAELYAFFMPSPPKKATATDDFAWVHLATRKKGLKSALHFIRYDGGKKVIVATDTFRLHTAKKDKGYADHFLDGAGIFVDVSYQYPQYQMIVDAAKQGEDQGTHTAKSFVVDPYAQTPTVVFESSFGPMRFNANHINEAIVGAERFNIRCEGLTKPILIDLNETRQAVVMPYLD